MYVYLARSSVLEHIIERLLGDTEECLLVAAHVHLLANHIKSNIQTVTVKFLRHTGKVGTVDG